MVFCYVHGWGGGECSRRRRGFPFLGLFCGLGAFSGFLGGDYRGLVAVECSLFGGGVVGVVVAGVGDVVVRIV